MANYQRPGVFVKEVPATAQPLSSLPTSVAASLGITERGPANVAVLCGGWNDYTNKYAQGLASPFYANGYNGYSVFGYYSNGGQSHYQVRVTSATAAPAAYTYVDNAGSPANVLVFTASFIMPDNSIVNDPGLWGNALSINLTANVANPAFYDVAILLSGTQVEVFKSCSLTATDVNYINKVINGNSKYISVQRVGATIPNPSLLGSAKALIGGLDGIPTGSDFVSALNALDVIRDQVNLIIVPDNQAVATVQAAYGKAATYNAFFIGDGNLTDTVATAVTFRGNFATDYGAIYFPWVLVNDPISGTPNNPTKFVPTCGHVAGDYASTDASRGTHKAPAGIVDGYLAGVQGTKVVFSTTDEDTLTSNQINVIKAIKNTGIVIWGARTLSVKPSMLYVPIRRELSKIENAANAGTKWAVFEPNNEDTWRKIRVGLRDYLFSEMGKGAFAGVKADGSDSFYVICDASINNSSTNLISAKIGVAQVVPGEFVELTIGQVTFN